MKLHLILFAVTGLLVGAVASSFAVPVGFTDPSQFFASLPGPSQTVDFENEGPGTPIPPGGFLDGITFNYDFGGGVILEVSSGFSTTSGSDYLGTTDGGVLQDGDEFDLAFDPVNALGMYFISADDMFDDDITLSAGLGSVGLDTSQFTQLADGSNAYFLGLIDTENPFTTAQIGNLGGGFFLYNVDDITTAVSAQAVPEPRGVALLGAALAGLVAWDWRKRQSVSA